MNQYENSSGILTLEQFAVLACVSQYDLSLMIEKNAYVEGGTISIYDRDEDGTIFLKESDLANFREKFDKFREYMDSHFNEKGQELAEEYEDREYGEEISYESSEEEESAEETEEVEEEEEEEELPEEEFIDDEEDEDAKKKKKKREKEKKKREQERIERQKAEENARKLESLRLQEYEKEYETRKINAQKLQEQLNIANEKQRELTALNEQLSEIEKKIQEKIAIESEYDRQQRVAEEVRLETQRKEEERKSYENLRESANDYKEKSKENNSSFGKQGIDFSGSGENYSLENAVKEQEIQTQNLKNAATKEQYHSVYEQSKTSTTKESGSLESLRELENKKEEIKKSINAAKEAAQKAEAEMHRVVIAANDYDARQDVKRIESASFLSSEEKRELAYRRENENIEQKFLKETNFYNSQTENVKAAIIDNYDNIIATAETRRIEERNAVRQSSILTPSEIEEGCRRVDERYDNKINELITQKNKQLYEADIGRLDAIRQAENNKIEEQRIAQSMQIELTRIAAMEQLKKDYPTPDVGYAAKLQAINENAAKENKSAEIYAAQRKAENDNKYTYNSVLLSITQRSDAYNSQVEFISNNSRLSDSQKQEYLTNAFNDFLKSNTQYSEMFTSAFENSKQNFDNYSYRVKETPDFAKREIQHEYSSGGRLEKPSSKNDAYVEGFKGSGDDFRTQINALNSFTEARKKQLTDFETAQKAAIVAATNSYINKLKTADLPDSFDREKIIKSVQSASLTAVKSVSLLANENRKQLDVACNEKKHSLALDRIGKSGTNATERKALIALAQSIYTNNKEDINRVYKTSEQKIEKALRTKDLIQYKRLGGMGDLANNPNSFINRGGQNQFTTHHAEANDVEDNTVHGLAPFTKGSPSFGSATNITARNSQKEADVAMDAEYLRRKVHHSHALTTAIGRYSMNKMQVEAAFAGVHEITWWTSFATAPLKRAFFNSTANAEFKKLLYKEEKFHDFTKSLGNDFNDFAKSFNDAGLDTRFISKYKKGDKTFYAFDFDRLSAYHNKHDLKNALNEWGEKYDLGQLGNMSRKDLRKILAKDSGFSDLQMQGARFALRLKKGGYSSLEKGRHQLSFSELSESFMAHGIRPDLLQKYNGYVSFDFKKLNKKGGADSFLKAINEWGAKNGIAGLAYAKNHDLLAIIRGGNKYSTAQKEAARMVLIIRQKNLGFYNEHAAMNRRGRGANIHKIARKTLRGNDAFEMFERIYGIGQNVSRALHTRQRIRSMFGSLRTRREEMILRRRPWKITPNRNQKLATKQKRVLDRRNERIQAAQKRYEKSLRAKLNKRSEALSKLIHNKVGAPVASRFRSTRLGKLTNKFNTKRRAFAAKLNASKVGQGVAKFSKAGASIMSKLGSVAKFILSVAKYLIIALGVGILILIFASLLGSIMVSAAQSPLMSVIDNDEEPTLVVGSRDLIAKDRKWLTVDLPAYADERRTEYYPGYFDFEDKAIEPLWTYGYTAGGEEVVRKYTLRFYNSQDGVYDPEDKQIPFYSNYKGIISLAEARYAAYSNDLGDKYDKAYRRFIGTDSICEDREMGLWYKTHGEDISECTLSTCPDGCRHATYKCSDNAIYDNATAENTKIIRDSTIYGPAALAPRTRAGCRKVYYNADEDRVYVKQISGMSSTETDLYYFVPVGEKRVFPTNTITYNGKQYNTDKSGNPIKYKKFNTSYSYNGTYCSCNGITYCTSSSCSNSYLIKDFCVNDTYIYRCNGHDYYCENIHTNHKDLLQPGKIDVFGGKFTLTSGGLLGPSFGSYKNFTYTYSNDNNQSVSNGTRIQTKNLIFVDAELLVDNGVSTFSQLYRFVNCSSATFIGTASALQNGILRFYYIVSCPGHNQVGYCSNVDGSGTYSLSGIDLRTATVTDNNRATIAHEKTYSTISPNSVIRTSATETLVRIDEGCLGHKVCGGHIKCKGHYYCPEHEVDYCTGHLTLNIKGLITDYYDTFSDDPKRTKSWCFYRDASVTMNEVSNTFGVSMEELGETIGGWFTDPEIEEEDDFAFSWNDDFIASYCDNLVEADWLADYNFDDEELASTRGDQIRITGPMERSKVAFYQNQVQSILREQVGEGSMSEAESVTRSAITLQALNSVGCIPYYEEGVPYNGRNGRPVFTLEDSKYGSHIDEEDADGRTLQGLGYAGWVYWVYNAAYTKDPTMNNINSAIRYSNMVPSQCKNVVDLFAAGTSIYDPDDLKPGDVLVADNGDCAIFICRTESGDPIWAYSNVAHENVGLATGHINRWDYYKRYIYS